LAADIRQPAGARRDPRAPPRQKKIVTVFPAANVKMAHDAKAFPACPGPIDLKGDAERKTVAIHGMYLRPQSAGRLRLVVVHHGATS
jgi:hypothetical protein